MCGLTVWAERLHQHGVLANVQHRRIQAFLSTLL